MIYPQWLAQVHRASREQEQTPRHPPSSSSPLRVSEVMCVTTQSQGSLPTGGILTASCGTAVTSGDHTSGHQDELSSLLPLHASRPAMSGNPPASFPPQSKHSTLLINGSPPHQPHTVTANSISQSYQAKPLAVTTGPIMHTQLTFTAAQTPTFTAAQTPTFTTAQTPTFTAAQTPTFSTVTSAVKQQSFQATSSARAPGWPKPPLHMTSQLKVAKIPLSAHHGPPLPVLNYGRTLESAVNGSPALESTYTSSVAPTNTVSGSHSVDVSEDATSSAVPQPARVDATQETNLLASQHSTTTEQQLPSSHRPVGAVGNKLLVGSKPCQTESAAVFSLTAVPDVPSERVELTELNDPHSAPASHNSAQELSRPTSTDPAKLLEDLTLSSLSDSTHDSIHNPEETLPTGALPTGVIKRTSPEESCSSPDVSQMNVETVEVENGHATPPLESATGNPSSKGDVASPLQDDQPASPLQDDQSAFPEQGKQTFSSQQVPQDDHSSSSSEGDSELDGETVVVNLLATLDGHLAEDQETASLMYTAPQTTDDMKEHITGSTVLTSKLTRYIV